MAFALVANLVQGSTNTNGFTTSGIDTTGADLLIFCYTDNTDATAAVSDSKGNTWLAAAGPTTAAGPDTKLYYAKNAIVGTGHTFTVPGTNTSPDIFIQAWSGSDLSAPLDQFTFANGFAATSLAPGSVTPSTANQLVVSSVSQDHATDVLSVSGGFTITDQIRTVGGQHIGGGLSYLVQTTAAAANPTWSETAGALWGATIATFKAAAGAAAGVGWDPRSSAPLWHPKFPRSFLRPSWPTGPAVSTSDIAVFASCTAASMCMATPLVDRSTVSDADIAVGAIGTASVSRTTVSDLDVAVGETGTVTTSLTAVASEGVAVAERGAVTIDYGASVASEQIAVSSIGNDAHNVTAVAAEAVAVAETGVVATGITAVASESVAVAEIGITTNGLTAVASEQVAVALTGVVVRGLVAVATEAVAVGLTGAVTHELTGLTTEGVAVGGTGTLTAAADISVFASAGASVSSTGAVTVSTIATAAASVAAGVSATVTRGTTVNGYLSLAVGGTGTRLITDISVFARADVAVKVSGVCTYTAAGTLPPLIPPFAAFINAYNSYTADPVSSVTRTTITTTSTSSSTPRTSTVSTTPEGVT